MAVFCRRDIQRAIDRCALFIPPASLTKRVAEINARDRGSLPAEWELMVSAAASALCHVEYEPDLGGRRRSDLLLRTAPGAEGCLVEIRTVSDEDAHRSNPVGELSRAIHQRLSRAGVVGGGTSLRVNGRTVGPYGNAKMTLLLGKGGLASLFDDRFGAFVDRVRAAAQETHHHHWKADGLDIDLTYDPRQPGGSMSYPSYTVPYSRRKNPVFGAMKAKRTQLKGTGHRGAMGLILCDGGCDVLSSTMHSANAVSLREVVAEHFRTSRTIDFVIVLWAEIPWGKEMFGERLHPLVNGKAFSRPSMPQSARLVYDRIRDLPRALPRPRLTGANAARCYRDRWADEGWRFPGGWSMTPTAVRISSRALLELLAGRKTVEDFVKDADMGPAFGMGPNPFLKQRLAGSMIKSIRLVPHPDRDDDEVEVEFGGPDPALSPFRAPLAASSKRVADQTRNPTLPGPGNPREGKGSP